MSTADKVSVLWENVDGIKPGELEFMVTGVNDMVPTAELKEWVQTYVGGLASDLTEPIYVTQGVDDPLYGADVPDVAKNYYGSAPPPSPKLGDVWQATGQQATGQLKKAMDAAAAKGAKFVVKSASDSSWGFTGTDAFGVTTGGVKISGATIGGVTTGATSTVDIGEDDVPVPELSTLAAEGDVYALAKRLGVEPRDDDLEPSDVISRMNQAKYAKYASGGVVVGHNPHFDTVQHQGGSGYVANNWMYGSGNSINYVGNNYVVYPHLASPKASVVITAT